MKRILTLALVTVLIFSLFSCTPKKVESEVVLTIPLVTWGGYAALFAANNGADATKESLFYKYGKFQVKLVQEENPANQLSGFANGKYQLLWSTMDMLPLVYDSLAKDPRTVPQVIGMFDYSNGGDGIIVRGKLASAQDLKGKKICAAQFTPSHYFLLWYLNQAGLTEKDIQFIPAADAIAAKDAFINDTSVDACVTWSPFIYDITDTSKASYVKDSFLLTTTQSANNNPAYGVIADVYLMGAELVKTHPEYAEAFCKAMIEGYAIHNADQKKTAKMIADFFGIKGGADEVMLMFADVTIGGNVENADFFDEKNPKSAYAIYNMARDLYKKSEALKADFAVEAASVLYPAAMKKALELK